MGQGVWDCWRVGDLGIGEGRCVLEGRGSRGVGIVF